MSNLLATYGKKKENTLNKKLIQISGQIVMY